MSDFLRVQRALLIISEFFVKGARTDTIDDRYDSTSMFTSTCASRPTNNSIEPLSSEPSSSNA